MLLPGGTSLIIWPHRLQPGKGFSALLAIQSEQDSYGPVEQINVIAQKATGKVDITLLPDCGHAPYIERPDEVWRKSSDLSPRP